MTWLHIVALLVGGALAAATALSRKPQAADLIGKLTPYQAGIGVALLVLGVVSLLDGVFTAGLRLLDFSPLLGATLISSVVCELLIGFLLGFGLIAKWIGTTGSAGNAGQKGL